ncbi:PH domain-containing protein [Qipengyuania nanhaisediminis]|uniref:PH domain-containing protein n=1 Tax=Qipengyuania nanhaisediminis TaxID=604088 RepID=UPI0038B2ADFE
MSEPDAPQPGAPRNTDPRTVLVGALASAQNAVIPALLIMFGSSGLGLLVAAPIFFAILLIGTLFSYIGWKRLTYIVGDNDIRVESGVLSRSARSVPYERIQDVSLEQKLLPRLFGLVSVKFETGAGGGEDLALSFLTEEDGERLRQLVRERRDSEAVQSGTADGETAAIAAPDEGEVLFAMGPGRLFTFGLFEFSLAVFAVLLGMLQYAESFIDIEIWDADLWRGWIEQGSGRLAETDERLRTVGAIVGLIGVIVIGSLTGMLRVFAREWGFVLERTARGFRRRRGLFTRTDVVMPIHRVQGIKIATGLVRYRFGWHSLRFVSLAQDMGAASHVVAPFARLDEIAPIARAAGFRLPDDGTDWHRASTKFLVDSAISSALGWLVIAGIAFYATREFAPEWTMIATGVPLVIAGLNVIANALAWQYQRHALDAGQIVAARGVLSPRSQIATRLKLHSVEIAQGPLARLRGYATLHLGQAGGTFAIPGVPVARAREVRALVMQTIAATDFSQLERQAAR